MGLRIDTEIHVAFTYSVSKTTENWNATRNSVYSQTHTLKTHKLKRIGTSYKRESSHWICWWILTMSGILNRGLVNTLRLSTWIWACCGTVCTQCDAKAAARSQQRQKRQTAALLCCLPCDQQATINMYRRFMEVLNLQSLYTYRNLHLGVLFHSLEHSHPYSQNGLWNPLRKIPKEIVELKA